MAREERQRGRQNGERGDDDGEQDALPEDEPEEERQLHIAHPDTGAARKERSSNTSAAPNAATSTEQAARGQQGLKQRDRNRGQDNRAGEYPALEIDRGQHDEQRRERSSHAPRLVAP